MGLPKIVFRNCARNASLLAVTAFERGWIWHELGIQRPRSALVCFVAPDPFAFVVRQRGRAPMLMP